MNYERKSPATRPPSVYSQVTSRSTANLRSTRSIKSLKTPWYQKPISRVAAYVDLQKNSMLVAIFSLILSIFTIITGCFDLYCYYMAAPGSTHYGHYVISYEFVFQGSKHVRNALVMFAIFSILLAIVVFVTSIMLIIALRQEYEKKMLPWLYAFAVFTLFRLLSYLFFCIVNDLIFAYNALMCLMWAIFLVYSIFGWILVYSLYVELSDLTKLEDLAHLRTVGLERFLIDGHHAVTQRVHSTVSSGFTADNPPQHSFDDASIGATTKTVSSPSGDGPSTSASFMTDATVSTIF